MIALFSSFVNAQAIDVMIYQHCDYQGYRVDLSQGNHDMNRLLRLGMKNDDISAVRVRPGVKAVLYQHAGFGGASRVITDDVQCLVDQQFSDVVSSIRVISVNNRDLSGTNGKNVRTAVFKGGRFVQTGTTVWTEYDNSGRATFTFEETGRDDWSVYVNDGSRNVQIQIDIHRKMIRCGENNGTKRDLYEIVSSSRKASSYTPARILVDHEQECFNRVQGKVAYNRAGAKSWHPQNVRNLCKATTNPSRTINCFENGTHTHGDWRKTIRDCQGGGASSQALSSTGSAWSSGPVNGWNLSAAYHDRGRFEETGRGSGVWKEYGVRGGANFTFIEQQRDDWSVYLRDASRNINLQIDVHRKMISFDDGGQERPLPTTRFSSH